MRCIKANRACGGYEHGTFSTFRQYGTQGAYQPSSIPSTARKCSMPKRVPVPGTNVLPEDTLPAETSQAESNGLALRAFFYDYCIVSTNQNLSRGYLSGLEMMAYRLGPKSDLVKACQAVAFGSHGKPLNRPQLVQKAEMFYQELLGSLARAIESPASANVTESIRVAMLLGLYQMTMASETDHGDHDTHARGLAALMNIGHWPLDLLGTVRSGPPKFLPVSKVPSVSGVFSVPALRDQAESLDDLLLDLDLLWTTFEASCESKDFSALKNESIALDRRFAKWQNSRVTEFKPTRVGHVSQSRYESQIAVGYWPGKVDTYFDLYVAGVWNIFRAARLLLVALIVKLSDTCGGHDSFMDLSYTANGIVEDMIASVPYHLADNLQAFLNELARSTEIADPGKSLGGLLLMHPLYVASKMSFLSEEIREYMRACLTWIGSNMGLGQATLLAKVREIRSWSLTPPT
ncbi:uncharacterized protein Z518_10043 [Rhinocladiella mackenziei CBS 650.93]|uniref:Rhinocladiella mackenziei CBS 650.93 unplaced genomic scaffold supercont1.8, whole genome shotgun sequence n=1 Tax=Rhinocladiella mackenziei CBS 650.93 TaxID=1442369 RepID=A0A0D2FG65_9EURO|nr:uncharacterized protein Z518_10043 [Rhinocladiella mackenziei CBS 650.93]KIX00977.1 hypothetical protein Z518_10043 [Rhinocladiella mackenziei CBS 650.93]